MVIIPKITQIPHLIDLPISHLLPVYPASQVQLKSATKSVQVPLVQGLSEQSSISKNQSAL